MDNLKGMGWMTLAMLAFALTDMVIVFLSREMPVGQILFLFGLGGALVFGIVAKLGGHVWLSPVLLARPVMLRNLAEAFATASFVSALALIPLSVLSAIIQANPLIVTLGAALFLGERVGWRRWLAIGIGLAGVLIIIRPGTDAFDPAILLAVLAVIGLSLRDLATRPVPREVPTSLLASYSFATVSLTGLGIMAATGTLGLPRAELWGGAAGAVGFGLVAYFAITAAMRIGDIAAVTPFRYTRLVFALVIAVFVFDEDPDAATLIGAAIVIATGLYTFWRESRARRGAAA
jgi:drug/metabolite transporter (DMT)-like permease